MVPDVDEPSVELPKKSKRRWEGGKVRGRKIDNNISDEMENAVEAICMYRVSRSGTLRQGWQQQALKRKQKA